MIKQETVFILGAGASAPYGYPTGIGLTKLIREKGIDVIKNIETYNNIKSQRKLFSMWAYDLSRYLVEHSNPDDLIDWTIKKFENSMPHLSKIGRMLIIHFILNCEKNNVDDKRQFLNNANRDWYQELFSIMTKPNDYDPSPEVFKRSRATFLTFNYDRSLDYFLVSKIENYYDFSAYGVSGKEIFSYYKPIHIYGVIANLYTENSFPFGNYQNELRILERHRDDINLIRDTFDTSYKINIQETISEASRLYFLGFGYDHRNLKLLGFPEILSEKHEVYGTAFNRTHGQIDIIKKSIVGDKSIKSLEIKSCDCLQLLREYPPV